MENKPASSYLETASPWGSSDTVKPLHRNATQLPDSANPGGGFSPLRNCTCLFIISHIAREKEKKKEKALLINGNSDP